MSLSLVGKEGGRGEGALLRCGPIPASCTQNEVSTLVLVSGRHCFLWLSDTQESGFAQVAGPALVTFWVTLGCPQVQGEGRPSQACLGAMWPEGREWTLQWEWWGHLFTWALGRAPGPWEAGTQVVAKTLWGG